MTTTHTITITNTGEVFRCSDEVNILAAAEHALCREIPVGCRNGGCGACKVRISAGSYQTRKMNRAVLSAAEEADGFTLACKTYPRSDIAIHVLRLEPARIPQRSFSVKFTWTTSISQPDKET
ncbi:MAG: 2Fe-2S iron-sulfur cluster binding domain-containing protein [Propionivibrio sp.]|jgi:ferredoxin|nr:2Fe-2S iron-sulfur cluster binding domain-containing protein [Propionivibrio sp.]